MNQINALIIILLVANLVATVWFGVGEQNTSNRESVSSVGDALPEFIDREERNKILNNFIAVFNNKDMEGLYNMFGPAARASITREEVSRQFESLTKIFGAVTEGAFSYSELVREQGSANLYNLFYNIKLSKDSQVGSKATLKLTIAVEDGEYQIYSVYLNSDV